MDSIERIGHDLMAAAGIEVNGRAPWDLRIHDRRFWNRVLRDRELGLGEAYQDGWWDADRVDDFLTKVLAADLKSRVKPNAKLLALMAKSLVLNRQTTRRAKQNATVHYAIGNDLYERMLDRRMIYSCGYWKDVQNLDDAQVSKLELICRKMQLKPGLRLLDLGCGWGGLAEYAAAHYGVSVVGISPTREQVVRARERCEGLDVQIEEADYRQVSGHFDRIVSVGMLEHVGARNHRAFFARCDELLADDGMMLHHTIGAGLSSNKTDVWFDRYIFPGGVLPSLAQIDTALAQRWVIEDVHNFGLYYDRTLMAWLANVDAAWDALPNYDERFRRTWRYYLQASAASFRIRNNHLYQIVMRKARREAELYQGLR